MANKKRSKKYHGRDAAQGTVVKKFEVSDKFDFSEWRQENRLRIISWISRLVIGLVALGIAYWLYGLIF